MANTTEITETLSKLILGSTPIPNLILFTIGTIIISITMYSIAKRRKYKKAKHSITAKFFLLMLPTVSYQISYSKDDDEILNDIIKEITELKNKNTKISKLNNKITIAFIILVIITLIDMYLKRIQNAVPNNFFKRNKKKQFGDFE